MTGPAPTPDPVTPSGGRWRLGMLTIIALAAVAIGVWAFGGGDDDPSLPTLPPGLNTPAGTPQAGAPAPDFAVSTFSHGDFQLSTHLATDGRPVILNLWASWCPPCRAEMPVFDRVASTHHEALIIGVAVDDDLGPARQFADEIAATYRLAFDADETVGDRYPVPGLPATFAIGSDGSVVRIVFGELDEDEMIALIDEAVAG